MNYDVDIETVVDDLAVIGMACRVPGSNNVAQFWDNLKMGVNGIRFWSHDELVAMGVANDLLTNPHYVAAEGVVADVQAFDADFFGVKLDRFKFPPFDVF